MGHTGKLPISVFYNFAGFALWHTNNLCAGCGRGWGVATDVFCQPASLDEFDTNSHPGITLGFWIMNKCFQLNYCWAPFRHYNILHTSAQTTPTANNFTSIGRDGQDSTSQPWSRLAIWGHCLLLVECTHHYLIGNVNASWPLYIENASQKQTHFHCERSVLFVSVAV